MRKTLSILILFALSFLTAAATDTLPARIVFYREYNYQGSFIPYKVYINDQVAGKLRNNSFFTCECKPGKVSFRLENIPSTLVELGVESGKSYYFRCGTRMGIWMMIPEMILVDSLSAVPVISGGYMRQIEAGGPVAMPKNRLQITFYMGGGFDSKVMFVNDKDEEASISFGGGFGFNFEYGRRVNSRFELVSGITYQYSILGPPVENADVTFSRTFVSFTPYLILPVRRMEFIRLKLGLGADYYMSNTLRIDASEVTGGFDDEWTYSNAFGFHSAFLVETGDMERFTFIYGLKYNNVKYKFDSGGLYYPEEDDLKKPDGSSLEFVLGFNYHF